MKSSRVLAAILVSLIMAACTAPRAGTGPYETPGALSREPQRAGELAQQGADLVGTDPERAEALLREALTADLHHGPAHNNLGVLHYRAGRLYEAAQEFQWAGRLMPGHPEPRVSLGLVLERAGRVDEALESYATALEVLPGNVRAMQALARCQLRSGRSDERTAHFLREIELLGESDAWRTWARRMRAAGSVQESGS